MAWRVFRVTVTRHDNRRSGKGAGRAHLGHRQHDPDHRPNPSGAAGVEGLQQRAEALSDWGSAHRRHDHEAGLRLTPGVSGVMASQMCSRSAWLWRNAVHGSASGTGVSRTSHLAPRPVDAKAAERCASIVGAKQKGDEPPPSHVSVTDVALSWLPQNATLAVNDRDGDPGADDRCRQKSPAACEQRSSRNGSAPNRGLSTPRDGLC